MTRRRWTPRPLPAGVTMTRAAAEAERADPDAAAVDPVCPYEADAITADSLRAIGFYPTPDLDPPF